MATLTERIDAQIAALKAEKDRIQAQVETDVAAVEEKLAALRGAKKLMSVELEQAYTALLALGLIREV